MPAPARGINARTSDSAPRPEESPEQLGTLSPAQSIVDLAAMVEPFVPWQGREGAAGAELRVARGLDDPRYPGVEEGARAHETGFEAAVGDGSGQASLPHPGEGLPQSEHLGVRGRVPELTTSVARLADHYAVEDDHAADRDLVTSGRRSGQREGPLHEGLVVRC